MFVELKCLGCRVLTPLTHRSHTAPSPLTPPPLLPSYHPLPPALRYVLLNDLSDHYPVVAEYTFPVDAPADANIKGCRQDSDCHLEPSFKASCYCTGSGCT